MIVDYPVSLHVLTVNKDDSQVRAVSDRREATGTLFKQG